jgi:hypothetical protein
MWLFANFGTDNQQCLRRLVVQNLSVHTCTGGAEVQRHSFLVSALDDEGNQLDALTSLPPGEITSVINWRLFGKVRHRTNHEGPEGK